MRAHLAAMQARLAPLDLPIDRWAPEPHRVPPFLSLEAPSWDSDPDAPACDTSDAFWTSVRVRAVAGTPDGVAIILANVRRTLPGVLAVEGRAASIAWTRSEFIEIDPDATIPGTNRHPAYGVDTYTLTSQPA